MQYEKKTKKTLIFLIVTSLALSSCAAGNTQFTADAPAGFWYGLWHGVISFIALIIHLFNPDVMVYELNNSGGWYDFGFLIGVACLWGGGKKVVYKSPKRKARDKEWEEIGDKVEAKVMRKLKDWADDAEPGTNEGEDWSEVAEKAEKKLKKKIREWAEKE